MSFVPAANPAQYNHSFVFLARHYNHEQLRFVSGATTTMGIIGTCTVDATGQLAKPREQRQGFFAPGKDWHIIDFDEYPAHSDERGVLMSGSNGSVDAPGPRIHLRLHHSPSVPRFPVLELSIQTMIRRGDRPHCNLDIPQHPVSECEPTGLPTTTIPSPYLPLSYNVTLGRRARQISWRAHQGMSQEGVWEHEMVYQPYTPNQTSYQYTRRTNMTRAPRIHHTRIAASVHGQAPKKLRRPRRKMIPEVPASAVCRGTRAQARARLLEMERLQTNDLPVENELLDDEELLGMERVQTNDLPLKNELLDDEELLEMELVQTNDLPVKNELLDDEELLEMELVQTNDLPVKNELLDDEELLEMERVQTNDLPVKNELLDDEELLEEDWRLNNRPVLEENLRQFRLNLDDRIWKSQLDLADTWIAIGHTDAKISERRHYINRLQAALRGERARLLQDEDILAEKETEQAQKEAKLNKLKGLRTGFE
ncbi:hypothetical protein EV702DRAFT_1048926 [Suillus placidus]|uniref:Uncharacterized protein n=1 Tax=Suillus placidus TaxID=48579 RepID=A0A9P6ZM80_9AGAM|nr:hypothetical protein EV702DRAFT_1048926 [Suillus placidus]